MKSMYIAVLVLAFATHSLNAQNVKRSIAIATDHTSLVLVVNEQGEVFHRYIGNRLDSPESLAEVMPVDKNRRETFEALPAFGGMYSGEPSLLAVHADGNMTTELRYQSHTQQRIDDNIIETRIELKDAFYPFYVTLIYRAFQQEDILTLHTLIRSDEDGPVRLQAFDSGFLELKSSGYWLTHMFGAWAHEMQLEEEPLGRGIKLIDSKKGVRTTQSANPAFMLSLGAPAQEEAGEVIGGALAWSGNYRLRFEVDERSLLHVSAGISPFASDYTLASGQSFETPLLVLTYSSAGKGPVSRRLHRWERRYNLQDGSIERPIVLNSWEGAYFKFNEDTLTGMMDNAAAMGVELFVLDDGWFGNKYPRNSDKAGLGDWQVNTNKLPHGIEYLIDHAQSKGLQFGIWVEPEMVNPRSVLAETHPDWIVQRPNRELIPMRNQLLLDLSNPDVQDFVFHVVDDLLTQHPRIAYIKWDCNRHVQNFGSPYLPADRQSHWWIDSVHGLYSVYDRLIQKHPDVIFQVCASGGGRVDLGALNYHHEFWASDNTDAFTRIFLQWSTSHFYPAIAMGSHVSASPNHQTQNTASLKTRFDVAMSGRLGVELQPANFEPGEMEQTQKFISTYKRIRPVIQFGDLYRLISPYKEDRSALMYVTPEKDHAVVFCYITEFHSREDFPTVRLAGLDPTKKYRVEEINTVNRFRAFEGNGKEFSGNFLMNAGVELKLRMRGQSAVLELTEVTE